MNDKARKRYPGIYPYIWVEGIGEIMSYPYTHEDGDVYVYARRTSGDPTSARHVNLSTLKQEKKKS